MASKRAIRRRACKGKIRHPDRAAAGLHLTGLFLAKRIDGPMSCYRCRFCGGWHVGHTPGRNGMQAGRRD